MLGGTGTDGPEIDRAVLLAVLDELGNGLHRQAVRHHHDVGHQDHHGDSSEVAVRVEWQGRINPLVHRIRRDGAEADGVAIRRRLRHDGHANVGASAGPVVDHDRLPKHGADTIHHDSGHYIPGTAGRAGIDEADRAAGPGGLRFHGGSHEQTRHHRKSRTATQEFHRGHVVILDSLETSRKSGCLSKHPHIKIIKSQIHKFIRITGEYNDD